MTKEAQDIVLVCNPRAGGRWKQLAGILDSAEAQKVRRIVTDSIDDIGPALADLGRKVGLVVIYGGDGTIQQILTDIFRTGDGTWTGPALAMVGGGTMNLTSRWCGWREAPEENFVQLVHDALTDKLATREVPMMKIQQGSRVASLSVSASWTTWTKLSSGSSRQPHHRAVRFMVPPPTMASAGPFQVPSPLRKMSVRICWMVPSPP